MMDYWRVNTDYLAFLGIFLCDTHVESVRVIKYFNFEHRFVSHDKSFSFFIGVMFEGIGFKFAFIKIFEVFSTW